MDNFDLKKYISEGILDRFKNKELPVTAEDANITSRELEKDTDKLEYWIEKYSKLKEFVDEFIEAWEDGSGGDSDLYRKAKNL